MKREIIFTPNILEEVPNFIQANKTKKITVLVDYNVGGKDSYYKHLVQCVKDEVGIDFYTNLDILQVPTTFNNKFCLNLDKHLETEDICILVGELGTLDFTHTLCERTKTDLYVITESMAQHFNMRESALFNEYEITPERPRPFKQPKPIRFVNQFGMHTVEIGKTYNFTMLDVVSGGHDVFANVKVTKEATSENMELSVQHEGKTTELLKMWIVKAEEI